VRIDINLIIWLTQLGISVAVPLAGFIILSVWLHNTVGWGRWVIVVGLVLGISGAVSGLRSSLRILNGMTSKKDGTEPPSVRSFNEHD